MDTIDRSDSNVPARFPGDSSRPPASISMYSHDLATPQPQIGSRVIVSGLVRHWWRILLLWLAVSTPLAYLIFTLVQPSYEAFSVLRIEPAKVPIYSESSSQGPGDPRIYQPYLLTQVKMILSDGVLGAAVADPSVVSL